MFEAVLPAVLLVAGIGLVAALLLAFASTVMAVPVNETEVAVRDCLPGANCGACGFSGCDSYAKAVAEGSAPANLCRPGGKDAAAKIAEVLGVEVEESVPVVAFVHCNGTCDHNKQKMQYEGLTSCAAAKMLYGGKGACTFGCLGCGDCAKVCDQGAICVENGIAHVDPRKCVGCGLCAKACPNRVISLVPATEQVVVACSNREKGAVARQKCSSGCIGCMKCQRNCPAEAITIVDNLAVVDYDKCTGCGTCVEGCPVGCLALRNK